jgi:cobalt-zinc-cadmium efflux system protein
LGNVFSIAILIKEKDKNLNMRSAYLHLAYDAVSSVFVIIAAIVIALTHLVLVDVLISIIIALMMLWSGFGIVKKALHIFMQGVPDDIDFQNVHDDIMAIEEIESIHELHIWSVNSEDTFLSSHICLSEEQKGAQINKVIQKVNTILKEKYSIIHSAIQIEYVDACKESGLCCNK